MGFVLYLLALAAGPVSAVIYWLGYSYRPSSRAKTLSKALPMAILLGWFWVFQHDVTGPAMPLAIAAALVGDIALSRPGTRAFLVGMAAFAVAHLLLIVVFAGIALGPVRVGEGLMLTGAALAMALLLWPCAGALRVPILGYIAVTLAMGLVAFAIDAPPDVAGAVMLGAVLFTLSDALIGVERFVAAPRWSVPLSLAIWPTYYIAMVLFAAASVGQ
ncbi:MAG: lysoplasmalogenase [Shimia sp.]